MRGMSLGAHVRFSYSDKTLLILVVCYYVVVFLLLILKPVKTLSSRKCPASINLVSNVLSNVSVLPLPPKHCKYLDGHV